MAAISAAASAFPGVGQAAQTGIELANRAIGFAGQTAAIGVQGLMETFIPNGSEMGDPSKSWFGKLAAGFAGARPAIPTSAGKQDDPQPTSPKAMGDKAVDTARQGPLIETMNFTGPSDGGQAAAREIRRQVNSYGSGTGH
jgi:hypothetical protein